MPASRPLPLELLPLNDPQFTIIGLFDVTSAPIKPSLFDGVIAGFKAIIFDSPAFKIPIRGILFSITISEGRSEKSI